MVKNYPTAFMVFLSSLVGLLATQTITAQELKVFTRNDFDLTKDVKSCLVITDYGKEEFQFDKEGLLMKSITRYNAADYDISYYKYAGEYLIEKRLETYRDGAFDKTTSVANMYAIDTTGNKKITERIQSYDNEFIDQYEYFFDIDERLARIKRSNEQGIDETTIEYSYYKDEVTKTYFLNNVIQKSIRDSKKRKGDAIYKIRLTKTYLEGLPNSATEEWFSDVEVLLSEEKFDYNQKLKSFKSISKVKYKYDAQGLLSEKVNEEKDLVSSKNYIYQYDKPEGGNWVKQIITPDNSYTTRKITYFENPTEEKED